MFERLVADHLKIAAVVKSVLSPFPVFLNNQTNQLVPCIFTLLQAQEPSAWKQRIMLVLYQVLLALCLDERPKVPGLNNELTINH